MVHPARTSNHTAGRRPLKSGVTGAAGKMPWPLVGEADMVPHRAQGGRRLVSTLSGAPASANDSGVSGTSGGVKPCWRGTSDSGGMRRKVSPDRVTGGDAGAAGG